MRLLLGISFVALVVPSIGLAQGGGGIHQHDASATERAIILVEELKREFPNMSEFDAKSISQKLASNPAKWEKRIAKTLAQLRNSSKQVSESEKGRFVKAVEHVIMDLENSSEKNLREFEKAQKRIDDLVVDTNVQMVKLDAQLDELVAEWKKIADQKTEKAIDKIEERQEALDRPSSPVENPDNG